jgi:hypothetical protein
MEAALEGWGFGGVRRAVELLLWAVNYPCGCGAANGDRWFGTCGGVGGVSKKLAHGRSC